MIPLHGERYLQHATVASNLVAPGVGPLHAILLQAGVISNNGVQNDTILSMRPKQNSKSNYSRGINASGVQTSGRYHWREHLAAAMTSITTTMVASTTTGRCFTRECNVFYIVTPV